MVQMKCLISSHLGGWGGEGKKEPRTPQLITVWYNISVFQDKPFGGFPHLLSGLSHGYPVLQSK